MMLAKRWTDQDVRGWLLSEKYDGCRAFWDGRTLRTRTWHEIKAPAWFVNRLPADTTLDGEIWLGRGRFERMKVLVQFDRRDSPDWQDVRFMVFDAPTTDAVPVEARLAVAERAARSAGVDWVPQRACVGAADAQQEMARVVALGGEGLMLRKPGHCYEFGRSSAWLKVKPAHVD